jgi:predicted translation initiation factor SUI1
MSDKRKNVLFLCTDNYYRSRFAEIYFNSVAKKMGLSWCALSKGLALERGISIVGPMAIAAIQSLESQGIRAIDDVSRFPIQVTLADFEEAARIIALKEVEHLPLLQERFPAWTETVEFWHIDDAPGATPLIEKEIMTLVARILGGGKVLEEAHAPVATSPAIELAKKPITVKVGRETKGRRGKGVTTVSDVPLDEAGLQELAAKLKQKCGTGGTVKDGRIEIQGDQRDRLIDVLQAMGYNVKRAGG